MNQHTNQTGRGWRVLLLAGCLGLAAAPVLAKGRARAPISLSGLAFVRIAGGSYEPLYPDRSRPRVRLPAFLLMTRPVTNGDLEFVSQHPTYRRDRIARIFADEQYLSHWASATALAGPEQAQQPATRVSWFAAKAFCESRGLRLPTEDEWELAAAASETKRNARADREFVRRLLQWYSTPSGTLPAVPHGQPNYYGVSDLHGVVWEWVLDFNNAMVVADSRDQGDPARNRFCGGAALLASDAMDYAAFMRLAMRSSLEARYTTENLGFRCAADERAITP